MAAVVGAALEDGLRVSATGAAMGFQIMRYRQSGGGHVAGACREESYFLCCPHVMLGTPRLNPRTSLCDHVGNYKAQTFDNTAWAYPIAKLLDVRLIAANGKGGIVARG